MPSPLDQLREVVAAVSVPVQAVGGLTIEQAVRTPEYGAPLVVLGAPLTIDADAFKTASGDVEGSLRLICEKVHGYGDVPVGEEIEERGTRAARSESKLSSGSDILNPVWPLRAQSLPLGHFRKRVVDAHRDRDRQHSPNGRPPIAARDQIVSDHWRRGPRHVDERFVNDVRVHQQVGRRGEDQRVENVRDHEDWVEHDGDAEEDRLVDLKDLCGSDKRLTLRKPGSFEFHRTSAQCDRRTGAADVYECCKEAVGGDIGQRLAAVVASTFAARY